MTEKEIMTYVAKWEPLIKKLAASMAGPIASAEDLYNEGVIGIMKALNDFDPQRSNINTFIHCCIRSAILGAAISNKFQVHCPSGTFLQNKALRDKQIVASHRPVHDYEGDYKALSFTDSAFSQIDMEDIIDHYDYKGMGRKYFIERMTYNEIAKEMGTSISSVAKRIKTIKRAIVEELKPCE